MQVGINEVYNLDIAFQRNDEEKHGSHWRTIKVEQVDHITADVTYEYEAPGEEKHGVTCTVRSQVIDSGWTVADLDAYAQARETLRQLNKKYEKGPKA